MTYERPGVYINERLLPAAITVEGTANAAGAVIGAFAQGPTQVTRVTSWYEFVRIFGGYNAAFPATFGVGLFFRNGGSELYVRRVVHSDAHQANTTVIDALSAPVLEFTAISYGSQGNDLRVQLASNGAGLYDLTVYQEGLNNDSNTTTNDVVLERFTNLSLNNSTSGDYIENVVNLQSKFVTVSVVSIVGTQKNISSVGLASNVVTMLTSTAHGFKVGDTISISGLADDGTDHYSDLNGGSYVLTTGTTGSTLKFEKTHADLPTTTASGVITGAKATVTAEHAKTPTTAIFPFINGSNGTTPNAADYLGTDNAVLEDFGTIDRPLVFFVPEVVAQLGSVDAQTVWNELISWAEQHNSFVVLDTDQALDGTAPNLDVDGALTYASGFNSSSHAAVYYPNIYITDPVGRSNASLRKVGPAGAVVGLYLTTDRITGPFKAPAGVSATIRGAVASERKFTSTELDNLNSSVYPVNALRAIPGAGVVAMGARTLLQDGTANKYVNMRRSLIYIRRELELLTEFALFENNDERLWGRLRTTISAFLNDYRNQGGLRGTTPAAAYYVKCDAENNDANSIANGEVHIEVGVALQYPAEFVVINLSQKTGE